MIVQDFNKHTFRKLGTKGDQHFTFIYKMVTAFCPYPCKGMETRISMYNILYVEYI